MSYPSIPVSTASSPTGTACMDTDISMDQRRRRRSRKTAVHWLAAAVCVLSALTAMHAPASAQLYIQRQEAFLDGDSLRLVFDMYCNDHQHAQSYQIDISEDNTPVGGVSVKHYEHSDSIPMSVAVLFNDAYISGSHYNEVMEYLQLFRSRLANFYVVGTQRSTPDVIPYQGSDSLFSEQMEQRIQFGSTKLFDGLNAAANAVIRDDVPLRFILVIANEHDLEGDSLMSEYARKSKNYSINTRLLNYWNTSMKGVVQTWLADIAGVQSYYVSDFPNMSLYMEQYTKNIALYNKPNVVTVKRATENDGKVHTAYNLVTACGGSRGQATSFRTFDDSIRYRKQPVTLKVRVPNKLSQQDLTAYFDIVDQNQERQRIEPLLLYLETAKNKVNIRNFTFDGTTVTNTSNSRNATEYNTALLALRYEGDTLRRFLAKAELDVFGTIQPGEELFKEIKVVSGDGRHEWNVEVETFDVSATLPIHTNMGIPACPGQTLVLSAQDGYTNYTWSTGETGPTTQVSQPLHVWYTAYDSSGIKRFSDTLYVSFRLALHPKLNHPNDTLVCAESIQNEQFTLETTQRYHVYEWNTGERGRSISVRKSGTYWVRVTDASGCKETTESVSVTLLPKPHITLYTFPDTRVCEGTAVELRATVFDVQSITWSNGVAGDIITVSESGNYYVTVVDNYGCVHRSDTIHVEVLPQPQPGISGSLSACYNTVQTYSIQNPSAGHTYTWTAVGGIVLSGQSTGAADILWLESDYGTLRVVESNGICERATSVDVNLRPFNIPEIEAGGETAFCPGDTVRLRTKKAYADYLWSNGAATRDIFVSAPGAYTVTTVDSSGCTGTSSPIEVRVYPRPPKPAITLEGEMLAAPVSGAYQWFRNDTAMAGETGRRLALRRNGSYRVQVTNAFGCKALSDSFEVDFVGVRPRSEQAAAIAVYPTIAGDAVTITRTKGQNAAVEVSNALGIRVMQKNWPAGSGRLRLPVHQLQPGFYFVRVFAGAGTKTFKILVR